ncbi:unnamed protein product [Prunus armeniaca]|nr:unnamed protein product [Prunus armeniaca]
MMPNASMAQAVGGLTYTSKASAKPLEGQHIPQAGGGFCLFYTWAKPHVSSSSSFDFRAHLINHPMTASLHHL